MSSSTRHRISYHGDDVQVDVGPGRPAHDALRPGRTTHTVRALGWLHRDTGPTGRPQGWAATSTADEHSGPQPTRAAALTWLLDADVRRAEAARARGRRQPTATTGPEAETSRAAHAAWKRAEEDLRRAAAHGTEEEVAEARAAEETAFHAYRAARTAESAARQAARTAG